MARMQRVSLHIINVKLYSNDRKGDDAYIELFQDIYRNKKAVTVRGAHAIIIRRMSREKLNGELVLYGKISRFTKIEGTEWLNLASLEREELELPKDLFPDLVETDFYFLPRAHRFSFVLKNSNVSLVNVEKFLEVALESVKKDGESIELVTEQSSDGFEAILNAKEIQRLKIEVSYSNADNYAAAAAVLDRQLKKSKTKNIIIQAQPDHGGNIDITESDIYQGALELAKSNGNVVSKIKDENDKTRIVKTKNYPKKVKVEATDVEDIRLKIVEKIINLFR